MQILPTSDSSKAPKGYTPLLERSVSPAQPFAKVINRLIDKAREQSSGDSGNTVSTQAKSVKLVKNTAKTKSEIDVAGKMARLEAAVPHDLTVDRASLAGIKNKLKEYGMSDADIKDISDEITSEGEISWKRLQKIISNKLELSDENFDPELSEQDQVELLSFFQKLNFTLDQSNRLLEAVSGSDQAEDAWKLVRKHLNALPDDSLKTVTTTEVAALAKGLGISGSTQLSDSIMAQPEKDGSKVKNAVNLLFTQAEQQDSFLSEKAAALKDILHTGLHAATQRGENSILADNRESKEVARAKVRIEDGAEKKYGEKKTALADVHTKETDSEQREPSAASGSKSDAPVTQNKAYESESESKESRKEAREKTAGLQNKGGEPGAAKAENNTERGDGSKAVQNENGAQPSDNTEKFSEKSVILTESGAAGVKKTVAGNEAAATKKTSTVVENSAAATKKAPTVVDNSADTAKQTAAAVEHATDAFKKTDDASNTGVKTADTKKQKTGDAGSSKPEAAPKVTEATQEALKQFDEDDEASQEDSAKDLLGGKKENAAEIIGKKSGQTTEAAAKDSKSEAQKAWEELLSKVDVEENDASGLQTNASQQTSTSADNTASGKGEISAARVMRTVETGLLSNAGQGRTQLTIRLDPPSLGQLTVSLQVKNDEVQAIIKTDSEEVGKMISDHLNLLRHSLEQHGLKVEKLDVQTQMQDNGNKDWQSAEQHNQAQQQSQKDQLRSSLRGLRHLAEQGESLSQEASEEASSISVSPDGLHLIA